MDKLRKQELEHKIENASPLDFVSVLQEIEQYEKEETKAVIDDLYKGGFYQFHFLFLA